VMAQKPKPAGRSAKAAPKRRALEE
jgi:hypothetical protein